VLGTLDLGTTVFTALGKAGTGDIPTLDEVVGMVQSDGIDPIIQMLAAKYPGIVTPIANGATVDFGTGHALPNGDVLSGSATVTYSHLVRTSTQVSFDCSVTFTDLQRDGALLPLTTAHANLNLAVSNGHAAGDLTGDASGSEPKGEVAVSGGVQLDTSQCARYPISGTVTVSVGGETKTITLNANCDGTFAYTASGLLHLSYEFYWQSCSYGVVEAFRNFILEDGRLTLDPACHLSSYPETYTATYTPTDITIVHHYDQGDCGNRIEGTLSLHNQGAYYLGHDTYTASRTCTLAPSSSCSKDHSDQVILFLSPTKSYCN